MHCFRSAVIAFIAGTVLLGSPPPLAAQNGDVASGTLTLSAVLEVAERDNPELLAAKKRRDAAARRPLQEATPPKPTLELERMYAPSGRSVAGGADEKSLLITQELPFPSSLYLRRGLAAAEAGMAEQAYRAKRREISARTRSAYAALYLARKSIEIFDENIELMRRFAKVAESKYTAGHTSQSDALKAQVELTKMLNMSVTLAEEKKVAAAMLNALLGRPASAPLGAPEEPDSGRLAVTLQDLAPVALAERPELGVARLGVERASRSLALARSEYLPDLMLRYRRRSDPMRGTTQDGILGFSVPLWFWRPAAMVAQAKDEREASEAELKALELATSADVETALVRAQAARRLADSYKDSLLPQADAALKVAEAGYQSEKSSFLDLLDAQRSLLNFRLEYYEYLAEYEQRLAELERAVGRRLP